MNLHLQNPYLVQTITDSVPMSEANAMRLDQNLTTLKASLLEIQAEAQALLDSLTKSQSIADNHAWSTIVAMSGTGLTANTALETAAGKAHAAAASIVARVEAVRL